MIKISLKRFSRLLRLRIAMTAVGRIYIDDISLEGYIDPYPRFWASPEMFVHAEESENSHKFSEESSTINSVESSSITFMQVMEDRLASIENKLGQLIMLMSNDRYTKKTSRRRN